MVTFLTKPLHAVAVKKTGYSVIGIEPHRRPIGDGTDVIGVLAAKQ